MKAVMLLATSLLVGTLAACDAGPPAGEMSAAPALGPAGPVLEEPAPPVDEELLCHPILTTETVGSGGRAFQTGAFWMLDLRFVSGVAGEAEPTAPGAAANPCRLYDLRDLYAKIYDCLAGGSCGNPFDSEKLKPLVTPIEDGLSEVATMGGVPVEVFSTSTRMRVLIDRTANPLGVLAVLKHLDPKIKALPSGQLAEAVSTGGEPAGEESDPRIAAGCCGGLCTPCLQGQCEPRPGVIVRGLSVIRYECACEAVCDALAELPKDCECRDTCIDKGYCDDGKP